MAKEKASDYFHKEEKYNCAQAVLAYFQEKHGVSQEKIDKFSACGGGRAEGGLCGALYSAQILMNDPEKFEQLKGKFLDNAGSEKCKEILKMKKLPCADCVDLAAQFIDEA